MSPQDTWTSLPASVLLHSFETITDQSFLKDEVPQFWPCLFSFRRCRMQLQSYLMRAGGQILWKKVEPNHQRIADDWFCNFQLWHTHQLGCICQSNSCKQWKGGLSLENLWSSSRYFSECKDLNLDGLAIKAECLRKDSPNKLYLPKQMGEDQLDDLEPDALVTLKNLDEIAQNFTKAKWWMWWMIVKCGGLISSSCPRNPHGKAGNEERRRSNWFC